MIIKLFSSIKEWEEANPIRFNNCDREELVTPNSFPCIEIIAYIGNGWDECEYIYPHDFKESGV